MREKALDLKKKITKLSDRYDWLSFDEKQQLGRMKEEHDALMPGLSDADTEWVLEQFGEWYAMYTYQETVESMRLPEG